MKKTILLIVIVIPLLSFGQIKKVYRKALRTTDLNEKIKLLDQVIAEEPKNLDAYFYRAITKNDLGDYRGAIVDYSKIIVEEPDADTYFNRGNSRYSAKDLIGAREDYAKAFMLDENFIDALYSLACVKLDLEEYESAIKDFSKVAEQAPINSNVYILRASAYNAIEQFSNAAADYSRAILIEPSANNYYNRGAFLMQIKYYKDAYIDLTKSIRLNKNNAFAYFYRGVANLFIENFDNAISDFSEAIKFDTMDFDAYLGLAIVYQKTNQLAKAKRNFDRANSIIIPSKKLHSIEQYRNTYWHQNHYFFFNNTVNTLVKIE